MSAEYFLDRLILFGIIYFAVKYAVIDANKRLNEEESTSRIDIIGSSLEETAFKTVSEIEKKLKKKG
ncbi:hypothetical protein [Tepidibacter hydrothermalis]|uniref:Uncharacterized protein n=1 Tax=Tepidibacter hydrothermalis TaxID=3036126 RepID=A0ABY8EAE4_9FIRM|nr:hypothetical protein [Tepidibacter hydrothermalis]WFD08890.1 hypothetical protein P4S50_10860 [Tepidibacter hydrothermalis]